MKMFKSIALLVMLGLAPALCADDRMVQKVYPVADLVIPIDSACQPACAATGCAAATGLEQPAVYAKALIKQVQMMKPDCWDANGGRGKVDYYPNGHALVVYQTPEVQQCVAEMLSSLRKLQDKQIVLEIRFVRTSPELLERLGMAMPGQPVPNVIRSVDATGVERIGVDFAAPPPMAAKTCVWSDKQVRTFLEAVQADRRTNVMQSPKLTIFNGQTAHIECGETKHFVTGVKVEETKGGTLYIPVNEPVFLGTRCEVQAVAKENCREIMLRFKASISEEAGPTALHPVTSTVQPVGPSAATMKPAPFTQYIQKPQIERVEVARTATVPCQHTLVMPAGTFTKNGPVQAETTEVPVLNKVPYVNRLFKNVAYSRVPENVIVLVTPRIIETPTEEVREVKTGTFMLGVGCGSSTGVVGSVCAAACGKPVAATCAMPKQGCQLVVVRLRNAAAADVASALQSFFNGSGGACPNSPPVVLTAEPVSNQILVRAPADWSPRVLHLIERLDMRSAEASAKCTTTSSCCQMKNPAMNLADVVALSSSSVSDEVIVNQIHTTGMHFTLSTEDILWLKKNKVSDNVVMVMQNSRPAPSWNHPQAPTVMTPPMPAPVNPMCAPAPPMSAPAYPPMPSAPPQYVPAQALPTPLSYLKPAWPTVTSEPVGPKPISLDSGFPFPLTDVCPQALPVTGQAKPFGRFIIGTGANSDAGVTGTVIINERNFDSKRAESKQAGEIGQQILEAVSSLVEEVATFTAEELPALLTDAAAPPPPKAKVFFGIRVEKVETK